MNLYWFIREWCSLTRRNLVVRPDGYLPPSL